MCISYIVEHVREKYGDGVAINIIYEDRPTTDFNSLFLALSGVYMLRDELIILHSLSVAFV